MNSSAIQKNIPLAPYTTFNIGGPADYFTVVSSEQDLCGALEWATEQKQPVTILGGGSNVLINDSGVRGLVVKNSIGGVSHEEEGNTVYVTAGAGIVWDELVAETVAEGLWGLENLSLIPGTVGATPVQNVGAYGVEVSNLITKVRVYDLEKEDFSELLPNACMFAYRDSVFKTEKGKRYIVTAVTYALSKVPNPQLEYKDLQKKFGAGKNTSSLTEIREAVISIRTGKFPDWHQKGTAGSFFHSPIISKEKYEELLSIYPGLPAFPVGDMQMKVVLSWFLDKVLHLKGVREEKVGTYERHVLVVVNHGGATARDVDTFAKQIEEKVLKATGIKIKREVRMLE